MSWFVLHPPEKVRILSFFITARLASQDDRVAFVDNVLEQLASLLVEPMPTYLSAATREGHLLGLLGDAAQRCAERGERLVLLVDGIDEDTGQDSHSIAAILPAQPPVDLRVIVAGRPDPPVPDDVPGHHPLRDRSIVRPLLPSRAALVIRTDMERDLDRILAGPTTDQDLLGLVVAAGGGLGGNDLAELTGNSVRYIERKLSTVAGRSFASRPSHWPSGRDQVIYVMGHEQIQQAALDELGERRLTSYRERLHLWADTYRERRWPETTPEYLLRGYDRNLINTYELSGLIALATDVSRQDRLLDRSGSDAHALENILAAQRAVTETVPPDLAALARLIMHRDRLHDRNQRIPAELPALWARLGHFDRAQKLAVLAHKMDVGMGTNTLNNLMRVLVSLGRVELAQELVEALVDDVEVEARAGAGLIKILAQAGHLENCRKFTSSRREVKSRSSALAALAWAEINHGHGPIEAQRLIDEIASLMVSPLLPHDREWATVQLVEVLATLAKFEEARATAQRVTEWSLGPLAMSAIVKNLALHGDPHLADELLIKVNKTSALRDTIADLVEAAIEIDDFNRAETLCFMPGTADYLLSHARLNLVRGYLVKLDLGTATEKVATISDTTCRAEADGSLVRALAANGDIDAAEARLNSFAAPHPAALTGLAGAMADLGHTDAAVDLARRAQEATHSGLDIADRDRAATLLIEAITIAHGYSPDAEDEIARCMEPEWRSNVPGARVRGLIKKGDLFGAEDYAGAIVEAKEQLGCLIDIAKAALTAHDHDLVRRLAHVAEPKIASISDPYTRAESAADLACLFAWLGDAEYVEQLATDAAESIESLEHGSQRSSVLGNLAKARLTQGELQLAEHLVKGMTDRYAIEHRVSELITTAAMIGMDTVPVFSIARSSGYTKDPDWLVVAQVRGTILAGDPGKAEQLTLAIKQPDALIDALSYLVEFGTDVEHRQLLIQRLLNLEFSSEYSHERPWLLLTLAGGADASSAVHLFACAYPSLRWYGALDYLARICPGALPAITREFINLQKPLPTREPTPRDLSSSPLAE
jgi:tetratricopeptide (TPR) repeat protein